MWRNESGTRGLLTRLLTVRYIITTTTLNIKPPQSLVHAVETVGLSGRILRRDPEQIRPFQFFPSIVDGPQTGRIFDINGRTRVLWLAFKINFADDRFLCGKGIV